MSSEVALSEEMERANLQKFASQNAGFPPLLKFKKSEYFVGTANTPVPLGTKYLAHASSVANGWVKFIGGSVVDRKEGRARDGFVLPERDELDSKEYKDWPAGPDGKPADPWVQQTYLPFEGLDGGKSVMFVTSSAGGIIGIKELVGIYANDGRRGELPVIELAVGSFDTKNYGKIARPQFKVIDWRGNTGTTILPPENPKSPERVDTRSAYEKELDDSIPF